MEESGLNREAEAEPAAAGGGKDALSKAWSARVDALIRENQALTRTLDGERHEKARLLTAVSRLQGENAALRETLAPAHAMSDEISLFAAALSAQSARLDALAEHVQRLPPAAGGSPGGANEAAERLHAVLTSRSWRLMRPFRGVGRVVRRLRG